MTGELLNPATVEWWAGPTALAPVTWTLATIAVQWLRYDATVWRALADLSRRKITARQFLADGYWCDRCSAFWVTTPALVLFGPVLWLAVNGGYLVASSNWPTLKPVTPGTIDPAVIDPAVIDQWAAEVTGFPDGSVDPSVGWTNPGPDDPGLEREGE